MSALKCHQHNSWNMVQFPLRKCVVYNIMTQGYELWPQDQFLLRFEVTLPGADPAILKRGFPTQDKRGGGVPTICPHSNALIGQNKGGSGGSPWIGKCFTDTRISCEPKCVQNFFIWRFIFSMIDHNIKSFKLSWLTYNLDLA